MYVSCPLSTLWSVNCIFDIVFQDCFGLVLGFHLKDNHGQDCIVIGINMAFEISEYSINIAVDHLKCNSSFDMGEHLNADQERSFDNKEASTSARLFHLSLLKKTIFLNFFVDYSEGDMT